MARCGVNLFLLLCEEKLPERAALLVVVLVHTHTHKKDGGRAATAEEGGRVAQPNTEKAVGAAGRETGQTDRQGGRQQ